MNSRSVSRRVGLIGGSFDPVHYGHLIIAQDAVEKLNLDEIVFIPASTPPHKQHFKKVDACYRLKMLQLAVSLNSSFSVSDIEILRGGISYTIDTVREIKSAHEDDELILVIGSDTLVDLHNWRKINELFSFCSVASFMRPGEISIDHIEKKIKLPTDLKERLISQIFKTHLIEISSTEIRERVKGGLGICYLVPPAVEEFIYDNSLYQA